MLMWQSSIFGKPAFVIVAASVLLDSGSVLAQVGNRTINPDSTVRTEVKVSPSGKRFTIGGGKSLGTNLFHSFRYFSLPRQNSVSFLAPSQTKNIFVRVTGRSPSVIHGSIEVSGNANFVLLNPRGIRFGESATLKTRGSFLATTAEGIQFRDGEVFSSLAPRTPLLKVSIPIGLQFGHPIGQIQTQAGDGNIQFRRDLRSNTLEHHAIGGLRVERGKTLALVGGEVSIVGSHLKAPGGNIEIGSVNQPGLVPLEMNSNQWLFDYSSIRRFGRVLVTGQINSNTDLNDTYVTTSNPGISQGNIHLQGSDIVIKSNPVNPSYIQSSIRRERAKDSKYEVDIEEKHILGTNVILDTTNQGTGRGGNIWVDASQALQVIDLPTNQNPSYFGVEGNGIRTGLMALTSTSGDAGDIIIHSPQVRVRGDFSRIITRNIKYNENTTKTGDAGDISVEAKDWIRLEDRGTLAATSFTKGKAGDITLNTGSLTMMDAGNISSLVNGSGDGGEISITADKNVRITGGIEFFNASLKPPADVRKPTDIRITVEEGGAGQGGQLIISTPTLLIDDEGSINANSSGSGRSGQLVFNVNRFILKDGGQLLLQTTGDGQAGTVVVKGYDQPLANSLFISGEGNLSSEFINPSGIYVFSAREATGSSGNVNLNAQKIKIVDGGIIAIGLVSQNVPKQRPGSLTVNASSLFIEGGSEVGASKKVFKTILIPEPQPGERLTSGEINLNIHQLRLDDHGEIIVSTSLNKIPGGNIKIQGLHNSEAAQTIQLQNSSQILAETTAAANGGSIFTKAKNLFLLDQSKISVSSATASTSNLSSRATSQQPIFENLGAAGSIHIVDAQVLALSDHSSITADTQRTVNPSARNNTININIPGILYLENNSSITTNASSQADGGSIQIQSALIAGQPKSNSDIVANAKLGKGGDIKIQTRYGVFGFQIGSANWLTGQVVLSNQSNDITAFSENPQQNIKQAITISPPLLEPGESTQKRNSNFSSVSLKSVCSPFSTNRSNNSFVNVGQGGYLVKQEESPLIESWVDLRQANTSTQATQRLSNQEKQQNLSSSLPLEEATHWRSQSSGQIALVGTGQSQSTIRATPQDPCQAGS